MAKKSVEQIVCEYRTMFEDVAKTVPNIRPSDDVFYSMLDYGKILTEMSTFLEGYMTYRAGDDESYKDKILNTTKKFYDSMFADTSENSPYRSQTTLADMESTNVTFLECSQRLKTVMESMMEQYPDHETKQLVAMSTNQYNKLAKVYRDDVSLYLWLATGNSKTNPHSTSVQNRVNFYDTNTPVMHRLDRYAKQLKGECI